MEEGLSIVRRVDFGRNLVVMMGRVGRITSHFVHCVREAMGFGHVRGFKV